MNVRTGNPQTALEAVTWRRLLVSSWPWRSAGYLLLSLPPAAVAFVGLAIPWLVLVARLTAGRYEVGTIVILTLLGVALIATLGPLIAAPLAELERRRLRMVDSRPVGFTHRHAASGPASWLWARYTAPATWREVGYACLLATVAPVLSIAALLAAPLAATFVASPFLVLAQRPGRAVTNMINRISVPSWTRIMLTSGLSGVPPTRPRAATLKCHSMDGCAPFQDVRPTARERPTNAAMRVRPRPALLRRAFAGLG